MRICLIGYGSRGDVQPVLALGRVLRGAGHEVSVAAAREFTAAITAAGLTPEPFDVGLADVTGSEPSRRWLEGGSVGPRAEGRAMAAVARLAAPVLADTLVRIADRYDGVVSGLLTFDPLLSVAAERGVRHALASFAPTRPSRIGGATIFAVRPEAVSTLNLVSGYLSGWRGHRALRPIGDQTRRRLGLRRQGYPRYVRRALATPALLAVSPHVVPPPDDPRTVVTGYWTTPADPAYRPPADLAAFLAGGDPPVYLGFGSMPTADPAALFATMVAALERTGRRGVVHGAWDGWRPAEPPDGVLMVEDVPHDWLFPRMAAVVHHGGGGTMGSAVRAGVPQIAVPHMGDQPYWGRRIVELGLGPPPIRRHLLDADNLAAALHTLTTDDVAATRARELAEAVRGEDGVGRAVAALARYWHLT